MSAVEFAECVDHIKKSGNPPGDPSTHRLLATLICKVDRLTALFVRDAKGKPIKMKPTNPRDYAPLSFPAIDPEEKKEKQRKRLRNLTLGLAKKRNG